jgi:hypothetical protein
MRSEPNNYEGETLIKVSALIKLASDILSLANDVAKDPAIATDIAAIQQDISELFTGVQIQELPPVAKPHSKDVSEDEAQ